MSQKVSTRKATGNEDKEKSKAESPVKEMKKKMAANAEKEKQAAEKADKAEKSFEKPVEKTAEKSDKPEKTDKIDKNADKKADKKDNVEKKSDKPETSAEKSKTESSKEEKAGKSDKEKAEPKRVEQSKPKQNGKERVHNGVSDVTLGNGTGDALNGTVKATRTPETPRPASDKQTDGNEGKDSKLLKLKEDIPSTDRKLRSSDSPKPQENKKQDAENKQVLDKKDTDNKQDDLQKEVDSKKESEKNQDSSKKDGQEKEVKEVNKDVGEKITEDNKSPEIEIEIVVDVESNNDGEEVQRKTDTNYSKSRVKVSPYRRSMRVADQTNTSVLANYTGNNTTMEMDITETSSSFIEEPTNLDDSSYLRGLRSIRGRSSYKPLKEMSLKHLVNKSVRSSASSNISSIAESNRPTGTVVGRKRKPEVSESVEVATEVTSDTCGDSLPVGGGNKRMRVVLERLTEPFRKVASVSLPSVSRRNAEIVGINTDLPLSAPVITDTFDPESIKTTVQQEPIAVPLSTMPTRDQHDNKRCVLM